jgi:hypothetical protein
VADNDLAPSLATIARRQSGREQWQRAIEEQRRRDLVKPSMGEQVGGIINTEIGNVVHGNPLAMIARQYEALQRGEGFKPAEGMRTALAMATQGMAAGIPRGAIIGMSGGRPFWESMKGVRMTPMELTRQNVLAKLIANGDFTPELDVAAPGKMWFRSLSPAENEVMTRIGWSRAPDVTFEMETGADRAAAWEKNIRFWHSLASPDKA